MRSGNNGEPFLSGSAGSEGWDYSYYSNNTTYITGGSKRWGKRRGGGGWDEMEGVGCGDVYGGEHGSALAAKKRVMVVVDHSARAKHAMMWSLTHVAGKGDLLTLLHVLPSHSHNAAADRRDEDAPRLARSLGALCKACRPEVEVEALVIQGPKLATVLSQVRKLEASVLVLSQSKRSLLCCFFRSRGGEFVEQCIDKAECLTFAVRKQNPGLGGYLVSTKWQKNFWLLA